MTKILTLYLQANPLEFIFGEWEGVLSPVYHSSYFESPQGFVETLHILRMQEGEYIDFKGVRVTQNIYAPSSSHGYGPKTYHLEVREVIKLGELCRISLPPGCYLFEDQVETSQMSESE